MVAGELLSSLCAANNSPTTLLTDVPSSGKEKSDVMYIPTNIPIVYLFNADPSRALCKMDPGLVVHAFDSN